jgi:hypothetical protein
MIAAAALAVVLVLMLAELRLSTRNERVLRQRGAVAAHDPVYSMMRWAYPAVFVAMAAEGIVSRPVPTSVLLTGIAVFVVGKVIKRGPSRRLAIAGPTKCSCCQAFHWWRADPIVLSVIPTMSAWSAN